MLRIGQQDDIDVVTNNNILISISNMGRYATKRYVRRELAKDKWSGESYAMINFAGDTVGNSVYNVEGAVLAQIISTGIYTNGDAIQVEGDQHYTMRYRINWIKVRVRVALGENETTSGISQTVRLIVYRSDATYSEVLDAGTSSFPAVEDVDAIPYYYLLYGERSGLYNDQWKYVNSHAADTDTTVGGQQFFTMKKKPMHTNITTIHSNEISDTEKGCVLFQVIGDDPDGTNAQIYGYLEVGWQYAI